jgi:prepilin-type N-terminal cleavage/methylation domain-containing protein
MRSGVSGFTLIELLVVIAIIGMLSSVVLASVREAKIKAHNAWANQQVLQFAQAIYQIEFDTGHFPYDTSASFVGYCLDAPYCAASSGWPSDPTLTSEMLEYIPELPPLYSDYNTYYMGVLYTYTPSSRKSTLTWQLMGDVQCPQIYQSHMSRLTQSCNAGTATCTSCTAMLN